MKSKKPELRNEIPERRAHQLRLAEKAHAESRERRAQREAELLERYERARRTGEPDIVVRRAGGFTLGLRDHQTPAGDNTDQDLDTVNLTGGVVEILNAPGHQYDYRVTVEIQGIELVEEGGKVYANEVGTLRPVVTKLETLRRADGPDIGAAILRSDQVGEIVRVAVARLARERRAPSREPSATRPAGIAQGSAGQLLAGTATGESSERLNVDEIKRQAWSLYTQAVSEGAPRIYDYISERLPARDAYGTGYSTRRLEQWVREGRDVGAITVAAARGRKPTLDG